MKCTDLNARIKRIRLVAFDVDGVLTDGSILLTAGGSEIKVFNARDGVGIKYLERAGVLTGIISGRKSKAVDRRASELGIRFVLQGCKRKLACLERLVKMSGVSRGQVCFLGDDLPDIPVMREVGLGVAVADAVPEVRRTAHWVTRNPGGHGAARELAEKILKAQGKWGGIIERYGRPRRGAAGGGGA